MEQEPEEAEGEEVFDDSLNWGSGAVGRCVRCERGIGQRISFLAFHG
jgi:hypothetical protein